MGRAFAGCHRRSRIGYTGDPGCASGLARIRLRSFGGGADRIAYHAGAALALLAPAAKRSSARRWASFLRNFDASRQSVDRHTDRIVVCAGAVRRLAVADVLKLAFLRP